MHTATPSSPASAFGLPSSRPLPHGCLLSQSPIFASRWVLPADPRIRCGPRLSAFEDHISLWLPGCHEKQLGNGASELEAREEDRCGKRVPGRVQRARAGDTLRASDPGAPTASAVGPLTLSARASNLCPVFLRISIFGNRCKVDGWLNPGELSLGLAFCPRPRPTSSGLYSSTLHLVSLFSHTHPAPQRRGVKIAIGDTWNLTEAFGGF